MKVKVQQRCLNKKSTLVDNERRFERACEQIVQLYYSLEALQQRYNRDDYIALGVTGEIEKRQWSGY
jgi:hypothetical protein